MARGIFKNCSVVNFKGKSIYGIKAFTVTVEADLDRDEADIETDSIIFGVQNKRGRCELETTDLKDVSGGFSVGGASGSVRGTAKAAYTATETDLVIVMATAYCVGIEYGVPHGDPSSARITWEFNTTSLSYA